MNQIFPGKWFFTLIKKDIRLTQRHLDNPDEHVEVESPLVKKFFCTFDLNQEKAFFSKRALFNKASDAQIFYFSKIGPDSGNYKV